MVYRDFASAASRLADLAAIDFYLADSLSAELGEAVDESEQSVLLWHSIMALSQSLRDGHSCLDLAVVAQKTLWQRGDDESPRVGYTFPALAHWQACLTALPLAPEQDQALVFEGRRLYLRRYWQFEHELAAAIAPRLAAGAEVDLGKAADWLARLFPQASAKVVDWQQVAVANSLLRQLSVIVGGPGTGKTYTVTRLLVALLALWPETQTPPRIVMAAPTGKAAQRLSESIRGAKQQLLDEGVVTAALLAQLPEQASTLHRLLGVIPNHCQFRHHQQKPLALDVLLVDEVSMVDLPLMTRLFRALPEQTRVILLGDADQLPSVAAGSVLAELAPRPFAGYSDTLVSALSALTGADINGVDHRGYDHLTLLTESRRFDGQGGIGRLAQAMIDGRGNTCWQLLADGDEQLTLVADNDQAGQAFQQWLAQRAWQMYGALCRAETIEQAFEALAQQRLLTSHRAGERGVEALNEHIEQALRQQRGIDGSGEFYRGRPIMVTENHYGVDLYNGDVGLIWPRAGRLMAAFANPDGGVRWLTLGRLPKVETVYAMTIHKTQGSEFDHVTLVLPTQDSPLLTRELLYTGVTRAKESVTMVAQESLLKRAVQRRVQRSSGLAARLWSW